MKCFICQVTSLFSGYGLNMADVGSYFGLRCWCSNVVTVNHIFRISDKNNNMKNSNTNKCDALYITEWPSMIKASDCTCTYSKHAAAHTQKHCLATTNRQIHHIRKHQNSMLTVALKSPWAKNSSFSGSRGLVEMRRSKKRIPASSWLVKFIVCVANHFLISFFATVPKTETKFCTVSGCSGPTGDVSSM